MDCKDDLVKYCNIKDNIKFLMISRKHSLGYVEFIRGRYKPKNNFGISFMFKQMTSEEIEKIKNSTFDTLWNEFWINSKKKNLTSKEYLESSEKFNQLKNNIDVELGLDFYVNNIKSTYNTLEWGFPKGRKSKNETELNCAIREFCEETNLNESDISICSEIKPIVENLIGTNGVKYRHIYYVAKILNDDIKDAQITNSEKSELKLLTHAETLTHIREYHKEKKNIITQLYIHITNSYLLQDTK
jgi:ADP-ribose pyrophosphatase YjhB (NUDIX family)